MPHRYKMTSPPGRRGSISTSAVPRRRVLDLGKDGLKFSTTQKPLYYSPLVVVINHHQISTYYLCLSLSRVNKNSTPLSPLKKSWSYQHQPTCWCSSTNCHMSAWEKKMSVSHTCHQPSTHLVCCQLRKGCLSPTQAVKQPYTFVGVFQLEKKICLHCRCGIR